MHHVWMFYKFSEIYKFINFLKNTHITLSWVGLFRVREKISFSQCSSKYMATKIIASINICFGLHVRFKVEDDTQKLGKSI